MRLFLAISAALALLASPAYAEKTCYKINKIVYSDKGGYAVCFHIRWWDRDNERVTSLGNDALQKNCVSSSMDDNLVFDLRNPDSFTDWKFTHYPQEGEEVWGQFQISQAGESKNCRGAENRFFYYQPDGGSVTYWSKGTTTEGNRCRVKQPESQYKIPCP